MSSPNPASIADGKVVLLQYTLRSASGEVLDQSDHDDPLAYIHGTGSIVPGLEKQLTGHSVGDRVAAVVEPSEGYGLRTSKGPQKVARDAFPDVHIEPGMPFVVEGKDGEDTVIWVTRVDKAHIYVDTDHPLAGQTLHFEVEVVGVRDATADELSHGHVHGPHGHHH